MVVSTVRNVNCLDRRVWKKLDYEFIGWIFVRANRLITSGQVRSGQKQYIGNKMSDITIRKANFKDLAVLLTFEQAIIEYERPFDPTLKAKDISYYDLKGMITAKEVEILIAESQGEIIGSGYAHVMESEPYLKHQKNVYLGFMYVVPECRGQGVSQLIINALKKWSASKGINEIRLDVYSKNTAAIKAYEKAGFSKNLVEMRMEIRDI